MGKLLIHGLEFKNKESAISFLLRLSFVKETPQGIKFPSNIKILLEEGPNSDASIGIVGNLTFDQSYEIRKNAASISIKDEFFCIGKGKGLASICLAVNQKLGITT